MADIRQSTTILDNFNRVEDPLSHGGDWANPELNWGQLKADGQYARLSSGVYNNSYWVPLTMSGDEAECWAYTKGGNSPSMAWGFHIYVASSVGGTGTSDGYFWRMEITTGGGACYLYRLTNDSATLLDSN